MAINGGRYEADALADKAIELWAGQEPPFTVLTGGEQLLQVDEPLLDALKRRGFTIAVETNGTINAPPGIDWLCVSPKAGSAVMQRSGQEVKVIWPQAGAGYGRYHPAGTSPITCSSQWMGRKS